MSTTEAYPRCEASGLLVSRCRCPRHRIPKRRYHEYLSRRQRDRKNRNRFKQAEAAQRAWIEKVWGQHAGEHPEMWSEEYRRGRQHQHNPAPHRIPG